MTSGSDLVVREMPLESVDIRIDYFHDSSDEHLHLLGVDRALLPGREAWRASYAEDDARPIEQRQSYSLLWELDGQEVGFSSAHPITYGHEAFLHLHILDEGQRRTGLGAEFVRRSADHYFDVLALERLYSEPNALNAAPNRTLQRAGFRFLFSHKTTPGPLNFPQVATRWVLERPGL
jgi:RimJ/RimL family protein N-acetyltransferase